MRRGEKKPFAIPMNSMSDIAFLLLIFIMLVALINYRLEVPVDFAQARSALVTDAGRNLEVWVERGGSVHLDGSPASLAALQERVARLYAEEPDTRVHIIADRYTPYLYVSAVLEILQLYRHGAVSLVVQNVE
ncbi:MAG: biopolymer transporter ExbD [Spirochaetes bacterium]|nr:biopolymer transporter ExbD [Spirochaetota bacterium]